MKLDNFENWSKKIFNELKNKQKKVILLAGASCSGKSFNAIRLAKQLGCMGKNVAILPSDNYHRSYALILTEKTISHNKFPDTIKQLYPQIVKTVYNLTFNLKTQDKFNPQTMQNLKTELSKIIPEALASSFAIALKNESTLQNLDEPNSIDYKRISDDIATLLDTPEKEVHYPQYMFEFAESVFSQKNVLCGKDYDYIIVEGMYVLRPELLRLLDNKKIVKCAVNCEISTMLTRLLNRNSTSQEKVITNFVTQTMPSYFKFIQPTLSQASTVLNSTPEIDVNNQAKWQQKYPIEISTIKDLLDKNIIKQVSKGNHLDFLLEYYNPKLNEHIDITLRKEKNNLSKLTIKSKDSIKKSDDDILSEFDILNILSDNTKNVNFLIKTLVGAKYLPTILIRKERTKFEYNNTGFVVDFIPELGHFIKISPCLPKEEKNLRKLLKLSNSKSETYFDIYKQEEIKKEHQLKAVQFKVQELNEQQLEHEFVKHTITKTWLQINSPKFKEILLDKFKSDIDFSIFGEAYIEESTLGTRLIMLDLEEGRVFFKQNIEKEFATKLIDEFALKKSIIIRYDIIKSLYFTVKIDKTEDGDYTIRIRYDRNQYTEETATKFAKTFLNNGAEFKPLKKYVPFPENSKEPNLKTVNQNDKGTKTQQEHKNVNKLEETKDIKIELSTEKNKKSNDNN